jgi:leader peptidase (prepilin peptidase)/N-methyltransferase
MFAIAWLLSRFRTGIGRGDVHLAPLLGLTIGWFDPWSVLIAWFFALLAGGLVSAVLLGSRRVSRRSTIPYGPFLVLGSAVAVSLVS